MRVLVVDGSSGQSHGALGAVRALTAAGHEVDVAHAGRHALASRSRDVSRRHVVPGTGDAAFADAVRRLLDRGEHAACFPTSDAALLALDWPGADLVDKRLLAKRCEAAGMPHAASHEFASGAELVARAAGLAFPVAVKPATHEGGDPVGVHRAGSPADLRPLADLPDPVVVEEWLTGEQRAVSGVVHEGRLLAVAHQRYLRTWPVECGISCAAVTTEPDPDIEGRLVAALDGYSGIFQAQLIDGRLHDVNPRVFGSVSLPVAAGANLPDLAARLAAGLAAGEPVDAPTVRARPGVHYRWIEGDLRHVAARLRAGGPGRRTLRALRPVRGTVHPVLRWSDPGPTLARLRFAAATRWSR
jgi:predicted ATP-grasp superfamily ATP-dependent carboligase